MAILCIHAKIPSLMTRSIRAKRAPIFLLISNRMHDSIESGTVEKIALFQIINQKKTDIVMQSKRFVTNESMQLAEKKSNNHRQRNEWSSRLIIAQLSMADLLARWD